MSRHRPLTNDEADHGGQRLLLTTSVPVSQPADPSQPGSGDDGQRLAEVFTATFGYQQLPLIDLSQPPDQVRDGIRAFADAADRSPQDHVVVSLTARAHRAGDGDLALLPLNREASDAGGDPDARAVDPTADPVTARQLVQWLVTGTKIRQLALILNVSCSAEDAAWTGPEDVARWMPDQTTALGVVVVLAAGYTGAAAFPTAFLRAVRHPASGGHSQPDLPLETLVRVMAADPSKPTSQTISYHLLGGADEPAGFLPNPRYDRRPAALDLGQEDQLWQGASAADAGIASPSTLRSFTGRRRVLAELARWLDSPDSARSSKARVVTGKPGSGKSAVLELLAALCDPGRRSAVPADVLVDVGDATIDAEIDAGGRTTDEIFAEIASTAQVSARGVGDLLEELARLKRPLTLLIDAVDEAVDPAELVRSMLRPMISPHEAHLRLLLGVGSDLCPLLGSGAVVIDLDAVPFADPDGVRAYARAVLCVAPEDGPSRGASLPVLERTAAAIAEAAGASFLVAGLAAHLTATCPTPPDPANQQWRATLPRTVSDAVRQDLDGLLGSQARRAWELLLPLAYTQGPGLPWEDLWARLANALTPGRGYSNDDLMWLRGAAGRYVLETCSGDRSVYRLRHWAQVECLREGRDPEHDHRAIAQALIERVPPRVSGGRDWARADVYTRAHLATHAARAQIIDNLLTDALFLLAAGPAQVLPALSAAQSPDGRAAADAYRQAVGQLDSKTAQERAAYLELAARCGNAPALAEAIVANRVSRPWSVRWTSWEPQPSHRICAGHTSGVLFVAFGNIDGRPVAVSGGDDRTVRVWNLETGVAANAPLSGHTGSVSCLALGHIGGNPVAVSGSDDGTLRVWNLPTGRPVRTLNTGHPGGVTCVAVGVLAGRPVAASGGGDRAVRVWDLTSGGAIGSPITGHAGAIRCVAFGEVDGHAIVVCGSDDGVLRTWNLAARTPVGKPLSGHIDAVLSVAIGELDGHPIAISGGRDRTVRVWDLTTGGPVGEPLNGHTSGVTSVAVGQLGGRPLAISASYDHTVRIWDSALARRHIGEPFAGHTDAVMAVASCELNGAPAVVSGSADHTLRAWDMVTGHPLGRPYLGHTGGVWTVALGSLRGRPIAVSGGADQRIRVWDLSTHQPIGEPFTGHAGWVWAVALAEVDGRPVVVSGSDDHSVRIWDLATGRPVGEPLVGHTSGVTSLAIGELEGRPIAVCGSHDHSIRVWNLATGHTVGDRLTGHTGGIWAVAFDTINGQPIAISGSADRTVRLWDLAAGTCLGSPLVGHGDSVTSLAVGDLDGRRIVASGSDDRTVRVWDLQSRHPLGQPIQGHSNGVRAVAIGELDNGPMVISGSHDRTIRICDLRTRTPIDHAATEQTNEVRALSIGDLGGTAVIISASRTVEVRDLITGRSVCHLRTDQGGDVRALAVGVLDRQPIAVSGNRDHSVRVWNLANGSPIGEPLTGHAGAVTAVAFGELDGRPIAVSGSDDHTVRIWDLIAEAPVGEPLIGHTDTVACLALGVQDGRPVAISGGEDHTVRIWDTTTGRLVGAPLTGHAGGITGVAFGQLENRPVAVSGSRDQTVRVWSLDAGQKHRWLRRREAVPPTVRELSFPDPVSAVAFSAELDALVIAAGSAVELRSAGKDSQRIELDGQTLAVSTGAGLVGVGTERGMLVIGAGVLVV